jgi:hypothetical protein
VTQTRTIENYENQKNQRIDTPPPTPPPKKSKSQIRKEHIETLLPQIGEKFNEVMSGDLHPLALRPPQVRITKSGKLASESLEKNLRKRIDGRHFEERGNLEWWEAVFIDIRDNMPMCMGCGDRQWKITLSWFVTPQVNSDPFEKLLDGNYRGEWSTGSKRTDQNVRVARGWAEKKRKELLEEEANERKRRESFREGNNRPF